MDKKKEALGIKRYIFYIRSRVKLIKLGILLVSDNEWCYYRELFNSLNAYYKTHIIYLKYIMGKLDREKAKFLLGLSERAFYRYCKVQRDKLISFITESERSLFSKYPFYEGEQEIAELCDVV